MNQLAVYRSAGVKAAWTERARHACAHVAHKKARVRSRGFKLTGPDRMSAALRGLRPRFAHPREKYVHARRGFYGTACPASRTSFGGNTSKIFEPIFFSFNFVRDCYERIIVNSNLGRKDFIFLIFYFFFFALVERVDN